MACAGLHPHRRDTGLVRLLFARAVAACHNAERDHLSRLYWRSAAGSRRASPRCRPCEASSTTFLGGASGSQLKRAEGEIAFYAARWLGRAGSSIEKSTTIFSGYFLSAACSAASLNSA